MARLDNKRTSIASTTTVDFYFIHDKRSVYDWLKSEVNSLSCGLHVANVIQILSKSVFPMVVLIYLVTSFLSVIHLYNLSSFL